MSRDVEKKKIHRSRRLQVPRPVFSEGLLLNCSAVQCSAHTPRAHLAESAGGQARSDQGRKLPAKTPRTLEPNDGSAGVRITEIRLLFTTRIFSHSLNNNPSFLRDGFPVPSYFWYQAPSLLPVSPPSQRCRRTICFSVNSCLPRLLRCLPSHWVWSPDLGRTGPSRPQTPPASESKSQVPDSFVRHLTSPPNELPRRLPSWYRDSTPPSIPQTPAPGARKTDKHRYRTHHGYRHEPP